MFTRTRGGRRNEGCFGTYRPDPGADLLGDKFCTIVRTYVFGRAAQIEEIGQGVDHVGRVEFAYYTDHLLPGWRFGDAKSAERECLLGEFIDDIEGSNYPPVLCPILDKIIGPEVIGPLGPQPDA